MNFGNFATNVAANAGRSLIIGQELDAQKSQTDLRNAEVAESRARMAQMAQTTQMRKAVGDFITGKMAEDKASIEDPAKAGQIFAQAAGLALSKGDFTTARELDQLAHDKNQQAKERRTEVAADMQLKRENLARTAADFVRTGSLTDATEVARAAIAAGVNPLDIPKANTPEFTAWAKAQQTASMSSKEVLAAQEKAREFSDREAERKREAEERHSDREEARKDRAAQQSESRELRRQIAEASREDRKQHEQDRHEEALGKTAFAQTEKLNTETQKVADPLLKDRTTVSNVKNLLRVDSPVSDQQVREALPALLGGLKGRATGAYYKDNKTFGDVVQRMSGFLSQAFTGRYDQETRKQLFDMLDHMEKDVLDPGLTRIEADAKAKAKNYGLNPDQIAVQGDFTRRAVKAEPSSPAATKVAEGTTKSLGGVDYVFKDGGWWKK